MYQIGLENSQAVDHQLLVPGNERIEIQAFIERKGSRTPLDFERLKRSITAKCGPIAAANHQKRNATSPGELGQMPAECRHSIGFVERIRKQGYTRR